MHDNNSIDKVPPITPPNANNSSANEAPTSRTATQKEAETLNAKVNPAPESAEEEESEDFLEYSDTDNTSDDTDTSEEQKNKEQLAEINEFLNDTPDPPENASPDAEAETEQKDTPVIEEVVNVDPLAEESATEETGNNAVKDKAENKVSENTETESVEDEKAAEEDSTEEDNSVSYDIPIPHTEVDDILRGPENENATADEIGIVETVNEEEEEDVDILQPDGRNFTFYDESVSPTGNHTGEDAIPYASDELIIVADGLGGSGGFPHKNMDDIFFDPKGLKELFRIESDPETLAYAKLMFSEFYRDKTLLENGKDVPYPTLPRLHTSEYKAMEDPERRSFYKNTKKSGYYGSHIVAVLMKKFFTSAKIKECFDSLSADPSVTKQLGEELALYIKNELQRIYERGGFDRDLPPTNKNIVLPTTLASAIMREPEGEDYVELILFSAGDSRVYCFTEEKGFQQITIDDESESTAIMTNKITLSNEFYINCHSLRIKKPCAIFAASDGLFDMMGENLDFAYYMLGLLNNSPTLSDFGRTLALNFFRQARHDDSVSIALHLSDLTYENLKKIGAERCKRLEAEYQNDPENGVKHIFTEFYSDAFNTVESHLDALFRKVNTPEIGERFLYNTAKKEYASCEEDQKRIEKEDNEFFAQKNRLLDEQKQLIAAEYKSYWRFDGSVDRRRAEMNDELNYQKNERANMLRRIGEQIGTTCDEIIGTTNNAVKELTDYFTNEFENICNNVGDTLSSGIEDRLERFKIEVNHEIAALKKKYRELYKNKRFLIFDLKTELAKLDDKITWMENKEIPTEINKLIDDQIKLSEKDAANGYNEDAFNQKLDKLLLNPSEMLKLIPEEKKKACDDIMALHEVYQGIENEIREREEQQKNSERYIVERCIKAHAHELLIEYLKTDDTPLKDYLEESHALKRALGKYPDWMNRKTPKPTDVERLDDIVTSYYKREKLYAKYDSVYYEHLNKLKAKA